MIQTLHIALAALLLLTATGPASADDLDGPHSPREWSRALDQLDRRLAHYVDWSRIPALGQTLGERRDAYITAPTTEAFLATLNADLYETSHDRHLQVWVEPHSRDEPVPPPEVSTGDPTPDFGIRTVRRGGSVALLELTEISGDARGADAIDQAMDALRGADVLILDFRNNGGGGEAVQRRLLGHLSPSPLPLEEIRFRHCEPDPADREGCLQDGRIDVETRTADTVEHPAFPTQSIYILTSRRTFSAAEAIAYNLQASRQAVVVGETTGAAPIRRQAWTSAHGSPSSCPSQRRSCRTQGQTGRASGFSPMSGWIQPKACRQPCLSLQRKSKAARGSERGATNVAAGNRTLQTAMSQNRRSVAKV